jgi:uncharacterized protein
VTIIDTSALLAFFRADDPHHEAVAAAMASTTMPVLSPFVIAELDHLVATRFGVRAETAVLAEIASGNFDLPIITAADLIVCRRLIEQYVDLAPGLTDTSLVVLADRYATRRILTLDRPHFTTMRALDGRPFDLLP